MNPQRHPRRRRLLGALALLVYLAGGTGGALAATVGALWPGAGAAARGACGCAEGEACCGSACCAPAPAPVPEAATDLPDCCRPASEPVLPDCCAAGSDAAPAAEAARAAAAPSALAFVARCTCGHRDHQAAFTHTLDAHVPAVAAARLCPPPFLRGATAPAPLVAGRRPEPRDGVPKPPCRHA